MVAVEKFFRGSEFGVQDGDGRMLGGVLSEVIFRIILKNNLLTLTNLTEHSLID
jgi:hypothetical protein